MSDEERSKALRSCTLEQLAELGPDRLRAALSLTNEDSFTVWEEISEGWGGSLHRIRVPGGWLYRAFTLEEAAGQDPTDYSRWVPAIALTFVPLPR